MVESTSAQSQRLLNEELREGSTLVTAVTASSGLFPDTIKCITLSHVPDAQFEASGNVLKALLDGEQMVVVKGSWDSHTELNILLALSHPNIVTLKYFFSKPDPFTGQGNVHLVLEFLPETMHTHIRKAGARGIPINSVRLYGYQLFVALSYIHSIGVCHGDIKPANLLVNAESGVLKVCDFNLAQRLGVGHRRCTVCTWNYRPPEIVCPADIQYTESVDVWSAACVLAEMLCGHRLFESKLDDVRGQMQEFVSIIGRPECPRMLESMLRHQIDVDRLPVPWWRWVILRAPVALQSVLNKILRYTERLEPSKVCDLPFFDDVKQASAAG